MFHVYLKAIGAGASCWMPEAAERMGIHQTQSYCISSSKTRRNKVKQTKHILAGLMFLIVTAVWVVPAIATAAEKCPPPEKVMEAFSKVFKREGQVIHVKESIVPGLCEVDMMVNNRKGILYIDPDAKFFFAGQILDVEGGRNLTQDAMTELNRLSAEEMTKLESLTAFSIGTSDKTLYYVTDPQCPYCKKGEETLKKLAEAGKVTVNFLFFPLPMHEGAEQECVSIICDNKGLEGLESNYKSDNQCPEGVKKVKDTVEFLKAKGVSGTPVYIFPDGTYHPGLLPEETLFEKLGIAPQPAAPEGQATKPAEPAAEEKKD